MPRAALKREVGEASNLGKHLLGSLPAWQLKHESLVGEERRKNLCSGPVAVLICNTESNGI